MLEALQDLTTGDTSLNKFHKHESKRQQQWQHDLGLNVKFEWNAGMVYGKDR